MNWDWFLGFVEADGYFCLYVADRTYGGNFTRFTQIRLAITQKRRGVLEKIQNFLKNEGIRSKIYVEENKKTGQKFHLLHIHRLKSCSKIMDILKNKTWGSSRNRQIFDIWCEALKIKKTGEHTRSLRPKLFQLQEEMRKIRHDQ